MAKHTFSVGGLTFEQAVSVNSFLALPAGGTGVADVPKAPPPMLTSTAPQMPGAPPMLAAPAMPSSAPPMPSAAPAMPAAPVASANPVLQAVSDLTSKKGAATAKGLIQKYTNTYPDGDPKKGSAKFSDVHPGHAEAFIAEANALAAS